MRLRNKKTKQIHFNTDMETYNKAILYKNELNNPTFEEIFRIGLNTICNEKNLAKARLKNINYQNKMMDMAIESNKDEAFKLRKALYNVDPHLLTKEDLDLLYTDHVENYCFDYVVTCDDCGLSIVQSDNGKMAISNYADENGLSFDRFYHMVISYLENQQ